MRHNNKGFTLLEILIALFIFAIVSMIMVSALHSIMTTQSAIEKNTEKFNRLQLAMILMSRDMEQIINRPITNVANVQEPALTGSPTEIKFTHGGMDNPFGELARSSMQHVHYFLTKESLVRETWNALDITNHTTSSQRILLDNVTDLRFQYLDSNGKLQNNWPTANQTQSQSTLPLAIRVTLTIKNQGKITQTYLIGAKLTGTKPPDKTPDQPSPPAGVPSSENDS